jgi:hypothetical protein
MDVPLFLHMLHAHANRETHNIKNVPLFLWERLSSRDKYMEVPTYTVIPESA